MALFEYRCGVCHTGFSVPVDGKCPICQSFNWGDKRQYYAKLRAIAKKQAAQRALIQKKIEQSRKSEKTKKR